MGLLLSRLYSLFESWGSANPTRILMLGLDAAGKTTILYKIKLNENICTIPTIGFNVETVTPCKGVTFTVWDVGGQDKIRQLWRHYYQNTEGLIYVVDSADRERLAEAKKELFGIISHEDMAPGVPLVIIANKQDLPGAANPAELVDKLGLQKLNNQNKWYIQAASAKSGDGIYEAMDSMAKLVKEYRKTSQR